MFLAIDAQYGDDGTATVAGVLFENWASTQPRHEVSIEVNNVADYEPGRFYLRELPCILAVLELIPDALTCIVVDGYVDLGDRPGLGRHLFDHLDGSVPVIGVAKSSYPDAGAEEVLRGDSRRPLFVTAAGLTAPEAAIGVGQMHGPHRFPTLLQRADHLARGRS
tara:strand:- start:16096 stop:16590 length:495 start_codon:yes stop_codon:yes gene_type:complete